MQGSKMEKVKTIFSKDTINYIVGREETYKIEGLLEGQVEIAKKHRLILVEWLMEVCDRFQLKR